jgi:anti-sigma B factor antagonist
VKSFGDERIAAGESRLIVDLGECSGMDSTFMGTLAGMATRLSAQGGGVLQVAEPGERNRRSLEDLGLDHLMEIDPPSAPWRGQVDEIRNGLKSPKAPGEQGRIQRVKHVLEAHQTLTDVSERNAREFSGVVDLLKGQVAENEKPEDQSRPD